MSIETGVDPNAAPAGADPNPSTNPDTGGGGTDAFDLTDENRLIRVKGQEKPVKFGDHVRGFQSQFTKASQQAARLKQQLEAAQAQLAAHQRAREQAERSKQTSQQPSQDPFAAIESLPYLSGKDAAQVLRNLIQQQSTGTQQQQQVMVAMLKKLMDLETRHQTLMDTHNQSSFDNKIGRWLKDGGYDEAWADTARKLYLAYEPSQELDDEFPSLLKDHIEGIQRVIEAQRQKATQAARKVPFVPGRGGQAGPSKPFELDPKLSPKQMAEQLWNSVRDPEQS